MKQWKFGIIGAGMIADFHAKAIQSLDNAVLAGICGSNEQKARSLAEKYNCKLFANYEEMLASDQIEIVTIATPSGSHMDPATRAAGFGKHVLCEKPMEISLDRIDRMIESHRAAGTCLGGILNYRFNEVTRHLKAVIESGRFGTINHASVHIPWWRDQRYYESSWRGTWALDGGGALMNQGIHMVDILQYLMGPVDTVNAFTATVGHSIEVEDTATAILKFSSGSLGSVYASTASYPGQLRRLEIMGTRGTVVQVDNSLQVWQFIDQTEQDDLFFKRFNAISGGGSSDPASIPFEPHAKNISAFIDAVESGRPFEINGQEARKAVEIVLAIYESARTNEAFVFSNH